MQKWPSTAAYDDSFRKEIVRIASRREVHAAFQWLHLRAVQLDELHAELAAIPAPPFGEEPRARWLLDRFRQLGLEDAGLDEAGNVLAHAYGKLPGRKDGSRERVVVAAHLDTVFPEGTPHRVFRSGTRISVPGASDNAAGIIGLVACAAAVQHCRIELRRDIVFAGTVGEEGEGDLRGMRYLFSNAAWRRGTVFTLVLDGAGTDCIVHEALGSRRLEVIVRGPGGHSWNDYGAPNPIVILSKALARIEGISLPSCPKTTLNVGAFHGGASTNSIPEEARIRVDIRSVDRGELDRVDAKFREIIGKAVEGHCYGPAGRRRISCEINLIGDRPAGFLPAGAKILEIIQGVDAHLHLKSSLRRASTDANIPLSLGMEAISIGAGGSGDGAHTLQEWYDSAGREIGLKRVLLTTLVMAQPV